MLCGTFQHHLGSRSLKRRDGDGDWQGWFGGSKKSAYRLSCLCSGKCYNEEVLTPMFERLSTDSAHDQLPYSVTLISMPATTDGKRGFSVSIESGCSDYATTVQVNE